MIHANILRKTAVRLHSLAMDQKRIQVENIYINSVNSNRRFMGDPHSTFQKKLTDFILERHSEEEMV